MPESAIYLPPWGQRLRSYLKGKGRHDQYVIPTSERKISASVWCSTFRIAGLASANHNLFYVKNASSSVLMAIKRITIEVEATAVLITLAPAAYAYKINAGGTLPTGGTASTKHLVDSAQTSDANCTATGASSAEGTANAITWTAPGGTPGWRQSLMRLHTAVGQVLFDDSPIIPPQCWDDPIILRNTEAIAVQVNIAYLTTSHYVIRCAWDEFTLP